MRVRATTLSLVLLTSFGQSGKDLRQEARDKCIESLSGFPKDDPLPAKPPYPVDLAGVTLTYFASGCYGNCPAFTLTVSKEMATFEGHAYVRAKGKHTAKVSQQEFETFVHGWYDGNFHAMRDNYCDIRCPDGTQIIVTDIPESSITLTTSTFTSACMNVSSRVGPHRSLRCSISSCHTSCLRSQKPSTGFERASRRCGG